MNISADGSLGKVVSFDSYGSSNANGQMADYINNIPEESFVLVAVQDHGDISAENQAALLSLGATSSALNNFISGLNRQAYTLIGYKGANTPNGLPVEECCSQNIITSTAGTLEHCTYGTNFSFGCLLLSVIAMYGFQACGVQVSNENGLKQ